ncbi:hypothetical protein [Halobacillus hunanensis]|uniref:hypothetical protein n=1 Tax=Halobacillus hunanensis TaxID=578214 RepID=UPI0009A88DDB|nr:hypothetical protein [Halobacillus hunanensis]
MNKIMLFTLLVIVILNLPPVFTHAEEKRNEDLMKIIKEFVPSSSLLISPKEPVSTKPFELYDLNEDGQEEIIITFEIKAKEQPSPSQFGAIVLKKGNEGWKKIWETKAQGVGLHYSGVADITSDGRKEYLFGVTIGASAGNKLEIFRRSNSSLKEIADVLYHRIELLNDKNVGIAVWQRYVADTYFVDVLEWNGQKLVFDEELYFKYYPVIEKFYYDKISKRDTWFYWYTLADAQIKAKLYEKATKSIQKGIALAKQLSMPDVVQDFNQLNYKLGEMKKSS